MSKRRVVVTGLGVVSSIGIGKDEFWNNLVAGKSGISKIETFDTSNYASHKGGEVKNFQPDKYMPKKVIKTMARASQFSLAATKMAIDNARLELSKFKRTGVIIGTTMADIQSLEQIDKHWAQKGEDDVWPINIVKYPGNELSDNIGYYLEIQGLNNVIPTACSAGNYSIGYAYDLIRRNKYDVMITGGVDPMSRITYTGFSRLYAMAPDLCRPFDKNRKGMMVGEGGGVLVLENLDTAKERGADIYAEILGYGLSCDAFSMTAPRIDGITKVIEKAIRNSNIRKKNVDYICAHGTGTPSNDKAECEAIKKVFGDLTSNLVINSVKSMLGHTMGAASAIEAITCCLAIKHSIIPPTINYETPDPECDIDCVPNKAKEKEIKIVLNNSLAFGGNNACVVLGKV